jgi:hypothetical protein
MVSLNFVREFSSDLMNRSSLANRSANRKSHVLGKKDYVPLDERK